MTDITTIYWAPCFSNKENMDWNILYYNPENIMDRLNKEKNMLKEDSSIFQCPSVTSLLKNTFALKNSLESSFSIVDNEVMSLSKTKVGGEIIREGSLKNQILFNYNLKWIFFAESDDMNMRLTSPFFSQTQHLKYGSIVPGQINIGMWFRTINLEYNLWPGIKTFKVEENEDLAYVSFDSQKKINLVRFEMNDKLKSYSNSTSNASSWEPKVPLLKRYQRFKDTNMKELILKEIKNNIVN
jgi:hypothetical protein